MVDLLKRTALKNIIPNVVCKLLPPFQIISLVPTFLESKSISSLTKVIKRITKIYDIKWV
jgi:hypothetical protein